MSSRQVFICSPVRSAIGAYGGTLKDVPATALGGAVIAETLRRSGINPAALDGIVMGNVIQAGNRMNPARQAGMAGGLPVSVPALTVNRVCGSGAQAVATCAAEILSGAADVMLAGGMENMDQAPYLVGAGRWGHRMGNGTLVDSMLGDGLNDAFSGQHSGWHTEDLVAQSHLSRQMLDEWAARSQQRFAAAQAAGRFDAEIVGIEVPAKKSVQTFAHDESVRAETTVETLSRLRPAFRPDGAITAGNAPGLNSGAAAMIVAEAAYAETAGLEPMGRLVGWSVAAVEPGLFGLGPVPAIERLMARTGWRIADVDRFEINEAFAAVPLAVAARLGIPHEVLNPEGGAIAHGHPIGATGAVLVTRLLHAMRADGLRRGVVSLCIGGGQGIALALELPGA